MAINGHTRRTIPPAATALQQFFSQDPKMWGDIMAFAAMMTVPVLIIFPLLLPDATKDATGNAAAIIVTISIVSMLIFQGLLQT